MLIQNGIRRVKQKDYHALKQISETSFAKYTEPEFIRTPDSTYKTFVQLLQTCEYFKCTVMEGEIVAWLAAKQGSPFPFSETKCLMQVFYHSNLSGISAVKTLIEMHEDLYKEAIDRRMHIVCSSSFLPNKDKYYSVLKSIGWRETSIGAIRCTPWHPAAKQQPTEVSETAQPIGRAIRSDFVAEGRKQLDTAIGTIFEKDKEQYELPFAL